MNSPLWRYLVERIFSLMLWPIWAIVYTLLMCLAFIYSFIENCQITFRMKSAGRYLKWDEVRSRIMRGEGTLVYVDTPSHRYLNRRVDYAWWIKEELIASSPAPLHKDLNLHMATDEATKEHELIISQYAQLCLNQYIHVKKGTAALVKVPIKWASSKELDSLSVVTISDVTCWGIPLQIYRGSVSSSLAESYPKSDMSYRYK